MSDAMAFLGENSHACLQSRQGRSHGLQRALHVPDQLLVRSHAPASGSALSECITDALIHRPAYPRSSAAAINAINTRASGLTCLAQPQLSLAIFRARRFLEATARACRGAVRARHNCFHTNVLRPPGSSQPPSEPSLCLHMHMQGCQLYSLPHTYLSANNMAQQP